MKSTNFEARYAMEHKILPHEMYAKGPQLMAALLGHRGDAVHALYAKLAESNPTYHCPYTSKSFSVSYKECTNDKKSMLMIQVSMPKPEKPWLCRSVYFCYGKDGQHDQYFTSELTQEGFYLVCSWTSWGAHATFDIAPDNESDYVEQCYWESENLSKIFDAASF